MATSPKNNSSGFFQLRNRADSRVLLFLFLILVTQVSFLTGVFAPQNTVTVVFSLVFLAHLHFLAGCMNHNHTHLSIFLNPALNRLIDGALSLAMLTPAHQIALTHIENHHRFSLTPRDWTSPSHLQSRLGFMRVFENLISSVRKIREGREQAYKNYPEYLQKLRIQRFAIWIYVVFSLIFAPREFLLYILAPSILGLSMMITVNLYNHENCDRNRLALGSNNFTGRLSNWIFWLLGGICG